ncbi:hypothetical protein DY000_02036876, partial [Brassica cretica]
TGEKKKLERLLDLINNGGSTTSPKSNAPFFVVSLASHNSNPVTSPSIIPDAFFTTHLDGNNELTKLKLTSDACDTTWQVKLNGRRFADGWEDFSNAHCLRNDDWKIMGHNKGTGQDFMRSGWRSFCRANKLKTGSFYRFELVLTRTRPTLKLCSKAKVSAKPNRAGQRSSMNRSRFMTVTLKAYMLKSRQLHFRNSFARENGIKKGGKINLVDKNGGTWPSCVASGYVNGGFYLAKGWISFCKASGITTGETFTLKFVREKGKTPMLQFCSKAKTKVNTETRFQKKASVSVEGEPSRRTHASHKPTVDSQNLECKQPLETIYHQVRQSMMNVLADVRRFGSELEIKEQNLEAVLEEIDLLGEKVSEINKLFK